MLLQFFRQAKQLLKEDIDMLRVIRQLQFLLCALFDGLERVLFSFIIAMEQRRIQLCYYGFRSLLFEVQVGGIAPSNQQVMRNRLLRYLLAKLFKKRVSFQTHDEAKWRKKYIIVGM